MRFTQLLRMTASAAVLTAIVAGAGAASAQDDITSVDELVVTAQKREQNLQDVPIVVTSLPEKLLENNGVKDIKDMQILTPGLTVTSTSNEAITTARIRGIGTVGDNPGLESSVGVVIDGVYRPRNGVSFGDLGEMQRIEVLKGPQGTLFGKNTSSGVINVITKAPSFTFGAEGELTAGNYGARGGSVSVTGPLFDSDKLAGRLFVASRKRDGFYDIDTGDGPRTVRDDNNQDYYTIRGQLLFQPSDLVEVRFIGDYSRREERCCAAVQVRTGPTANFINPLAVGNGVEPPVTGGSFGPAPGYQMLPFSRLAYINRDTDQTIEDGGFSAEANVDLDWFGGGTTFTSVTGARTWSSFGAQDIDYTGADILYRPNDGGYGAEFKTFSQEFRLAGQNDRLDWLFGLFYANEDLTNRQSYAYGADYTPYLSFLLTASVPAPFSPSPSRLQCFTDPAGFGGSACAVGLAPPNAAAPVFAAGKAVQDAYYQNDETIALFTNNTIHLTEAFDITIGLRYTQDDKHLLSKYDNLGTNGAACLGALTNQANPNPALRTPAAALVPICLPWANPQFDNRTTRQERSENEWSGTAKASYRWSPDLMTYVSFARGYKAGGFNLDRIQSSNGLPSGGVGFSPVNDTSFPAEFVDSWELGAKSTLAGGKLLLNAAVFHQTYSDFQLNTFLGTSFVVESIPEVVSKGVDVDFIWFSPVEGLTFQGGVTYAQTEYSNFDAADLIAPSHFPNLSLLPGSTMSFAPEWSSSFAASFDRDIGSNLRFLASIGAKYTSEYNTKSDLLPAGVQEAMTLVNGRIGFGSADERWTVEIWGNNLTDEEYNQVVFNAPLQGTAFQTTVQPNGTYYNPALDTQTYNAFLGAPRTYGVTLRVRY
jgi:outer membrane receptor protein involved in Fe transport